MRPVNNQFEIRAFATGAPDLEIDFVSMSQPQLATGIIKACLHREDQSLPENEIWTWSMKARLQALLMITMHSFGPEMLLQLPCSNPACGENIELPLELQRFVQAGGDGQVVIEIEGQKILLRLPNGNDQYDWVQNPALSSSAMAAGLILSIDEQVPGGDWEMPAHWEHELGRHLEQIDNLMTLQIQSQCPACNQSFDCDLDLESHLLSALSRTQHRLLHDIHLIASVYHWSENEIMSLSASRRQNYLSQIKEGSLQ